MKARRLPRLLSALGLLGLALAAHGQQQRRDALPPAPTTLRESGAVSVQEAMRRSPGVVVQDETGSDSLPNLAMRGVTNAGDSIRPRSLNTWMRSPFLMPRAAASRSLIQIFCGWASRLLARLPYVECVRLL